MADLQKTDSLSTKIADLKINARIDSLEIIQKIDHLKDSLKLLQLAAATYTNKLDSLSNRLRQKLHDQKVNGEAQRLNNKIQVTEDSVKNKIVKRQTALQQSIRNKPSFTDSLSMKLKNPATDKELNYSADKMSGNVNSNTALSSANYPVPPVGNDLNRNMSGISSSTKDLDVSKVEIPQEAKGLDQAIPKLEQASKSEIKSLNVTKELEAAGKETKELSAVAGKAETYSKYIKNIKTGDVKKVEALPQDIEKEAMARSELQGLDKNIQEAEATKNVLTEYQDAIKKIDAKNANALLKKAGVDPVPDYFAAHQADLQAGIKRLEKLKKKYGSIPDSRYLPKHPPSDMKGKALIERLVPGLNFQFFQQSSLTMADLSPFVMYRFTSCWRAGIGGTYRLQFNNKVQLVHPHDAFGYRLMTDYSIISGFNVHVEGEWMKMVPYDPITNFKLTDSEKKQWIPGLYLGILKHYKISPMINGNFQVLYNFLYQRNGVYPNRFNIRFGFELALKKKTKNAAK